MGGRRTDIYVYAVDESGVPVGGAELADSLGSELGSLQEQLGALALESVRRVGPTAAGLSLAEVILIVVSVLIILSVFIATCVFLNWWKGSDSTPLHCTAQGGQCVGC